MPVERSEECHFFKCEERRDVELAAARAVATETSDPANQDRNQGPTFNDQVQGNAEESPLATGSRQNQIIIRAAELPVEDNVRNEQKVILALTSEAYDLANQDRNQGPSFKDQVPGNPEESPLATSSRQNQITFRDAGRLVEDTIRNEQTQEADAQPHEEESKRMNRLQRPVRIHQTAVRVSPRIPEMNIPEVPGQLYEPSQSLLVAQPVEENVLIAEAITEAIIEDRADTSRDRKRSICILCSIFVLIAGIVVGVLVPIPTRRNMQDNGNTRTINPTSSTMAGRETSAQLVFKTKEELHDAVDDYLHSNLFAKELYGYQIGSWNVSLITDFKSVFENMTDFNENLNAWDVSQATTMSRMFLNAASFSGDISTWNVGKVTDLSSMFYRAKSFSGDLSTWNVSQVTSMSYMFYEASSFSSDISAWDVSKVTSMVHMFYKSHSFSGDLSGWDVSNVRRMWKMFFEATSFSSDLSNWRVDSVMTMSGMFLGASKFQSDISAWNVSQVTDMDKMFYGASSFQQNLCPWGYLLGPLSYYSFMFIGTNCPTTDNPDFSLAVPGPFCHDCSSN